MLVVKAHELPNCFSEHHHAWYRSQKPVDMPYMRYASGEVSTPNFFCALRKGKAFESVRLLCPLGARACALALQPATGPILQGFFKLAIFSAFTCQAYVCCGRNLKNEEHAWVTSP